MPLPGFNPLENAPPPGTDRTAASMAQAARLHQRITSLERELSAMKREGSSWAAIPSLSYINSWVAYPSSGYTPSYRISGDTVYLTGLIQSGGAPPAGASAITLPAFLRPAPATTTMGSVSSAFFYATGSSAGAVTVYLYPADSVTSPGTLVVMPAMVATSYLSLSGIFYKRRTDM